MVERTAHVIACVTLGKVVICFASSLYYYLCGMQVCSSNVSR